MIIKFALKQNLQKLCLNLYRPISREDKINLIGLILIIGFAISVVYHYIMGIYLNMDYPFNTFLFRPDDRFMDFYNVLEMSYNPYLHGAYFPFSYLIVSVFTHFSPDMALILFMGIFVGFLLYVSYNNLQCSNRIDTVRNIFVFSFLSYPFLISIDRANFEVFVFIFIFLFIFFYMKEHFALSVLFLSFAISMKLFPAVFIVLFLCDRKYKYLFYTLALVLVLSAISLLLFEGTVIDNLTNLSNNLNVYNEIYALTNEGLYTTHSLFGLIKIFIAHSHPYNYPYMVDSLFKLYPLVAISIFSCISIYIIILENEMWKKVALLVFSMNLLPYVSHDYKLMHIFIPLFLFINTKAGDRDDLIYIILFSLLLIPKDYYHLTIDPEIGSAAILNPLLMIIVMLLIVISGVINYIRSYQMRTKQVQ